MSSKDTAEQSPAQANIAPTASIIVLAYRTTERARSCIESILSAGSRISFEILLMLNAVERNEALRLPTWPRTTILRSPINLGFAASNNFAAARASGEFLVFLNDDALVEPGWLGALVRTARLRPAAGAIGSCITFPDGSLQEAGSIIWADGTTAPLGRGEPTVRGAFNTVAVADFCSANGLLVRASSWQRSGGFNEAFYPAYYEDVDLCLTVRHGLHEEVLYEPRSRIRHLEAASTSPQFREFLFDRNVQHLRVRWSRELQAYPSFSAPENRQRLSRRMREAALRVLLIDDRIPNAGLGSGFGRFEDFFTLAREKNLAVSFVASADASGDQSVLQDAGADLIDEPLEAFLMTAAVRYDLVILSRPHNYARFAKTIRRFMPDAALIYDCEALFHRRLFQQAAMERDLARALDQQRTAGRMLELEKRIARACDHIVCISFEEQAVLRRFGARNLHLQLPLASDIYFGDERLEQRTGIVFVAGWLAGEDSPNVPSLRWFVEEVLPLVHQSVPDATLRITGANPPAGVLDLAGERVRFEGFVERLDELYGSARVVISPMLYGAGTKVKTVEALQHGVPVVATKVGAEGIGAHDQDGIAIADDPVLFAKEVTRLLRDARRWRDRRSEMRSLLSRMHDKSASWGTILSAACPQLSAVDFTPDQVPALSESLTQ